MKRVLILSLGIVMIAGSAMADHFGIYTDQVGATENCTVVPPQFQSFSMYVVHKTTGATGSEFKVEGTAATGWTFNGASVLGGFLAIGSATTGVSLAYGGCLAGPEIGVVELNFFGFAPAGGSPTCGLVEIIPSPTALGGIIKAVDCNFAEIPATGGRGYINPDATCLDCNEPHPNATEESTWGKVKSLYR
jgi:hypothetical protein